MFHNLHSLHDCPKNKENRKGNKKIKFNVINNPFYAIFLFWNAPLLNDPSLPADIESIELIENWTYVLELNEHFFYY